jgi:nucleoside-diphosphate-sugar epimerase
MGFLKKSMNDEEPDPNNDTDPKALEETYQRLFMKIGRDFVHVDDFVTVIDTIVSLLSKFHEEANDIEPRENAGVLTMAAMYKELIDEGASEEMQPLDLIDLSEEN